MTTHVERRTYTHKPRKFRYFGGKTNSDRNYLAKRNLQGWIYVCSDWGKSLIKQKFDRNLQKRNLRGLSVRYKY